MTARFASGVSQHPAASVATGEAVGQIIEALDATPPDLVVIFASVHHTDAFDDIVASVRALVAPRIVIGATASGIVADEREIEDGPALALFAAVLPATHVEPVRLQHFDTPDGSTFVGWPDETGPVAPPARQPDGEGSHGDGESTVILLADPFSFPADAFLSRLNTSHPGMAVIGGLTSAARGPGGNRLALFGLDLDANGVFTGGAVGVVLTGGVDVVTVVSQGCRPVGRPLAVTKGQRQWIMELAGRPALERLQEVVAESSDDERELFRHGVHVGRVVDEHKLDFERGDFLVRTVLGADQSTGAIAVGDVVEIGQTMQFHVRDAASADDDLRSLLDGRHARAALVFTCTGRGRHLFGEADHDAGMLGDLLGPLPVVGFFCAGELGPIGGRNFLHGFTASVALFR